MSTIPPENEEMPAPRIRLLHLTTIPFTLWVFLRDQVRYLEQQGFEVHALSSPGPLGEAFAGATGVPTYSVPMSRGVSPLGDLRSILAVRRRIGAIAPHILHAHTPKAGWVGMLAARLARVPVRIYHLHGLRHLTCAGLARALVRRGEIASCSLAHRVLCVGRSLREAALAERLCAPDKIAVPATGSIAGVDAAARFNPMRYPADERSRQRAMLGLPADADVVGFVGRIVRDKGIGELACAWRALHDAHPRACLLLVGPLEPEDPAPPDALAALRADDRVRFAGEVRDPAPLYRAMDLVVLPTYREGFPVVPLEAAAMRLPVVASRCVGCVDAVEDGVTGTLVPVGDAAALARALALYLADRALRERHGRAGRERAGREFQPDRVFAAQVAEYRALMARLVPQPA